MKRTILTLSAIILLFSCNNSTKDNSIPKDEILSKSIKYLDSKVNTEKEKGVFTFHGIDTITAISSVGIEYLKTNPLMKEYKYHMKYFKEFGDIDDQFGSDEGDQTRHHREKAQVLRDSLIRWNDRIAKLDSTDTIGYQVNISAEGVDAESGAKIKDLSFPVYFDKEYDVSLKWNEYNYGKLK